MTWLIVGCIALGCALCVASCLVANSRNPDNRSAALLYLLPGIVLLLASVVLAVGNAAVKGAAVNRW